MRRRVALALSLLLATPALAAPNSASPFRVTTENGTWNPLVVSSPVPQERQTASAAFDPVNRRMILFGGAFYNDTWSLDPDGTPAWTQLIAAHAPSPRQGALMVYDSFRKQMILFGGEDYFSVRSDVWTLNLTGTPDWTEITPSTPGPQIRMLTAGIYDPVRDRVVFFGGYPPEGSQREVWALNLADSTWARILPFGSGPSPRWGLSGVYDPVDDRLVITAGSATDIPGVCDVWALSLSDPPTWNLLAVSGAPPSARFLSTAVYETARQRVLLFGGYSSQALNEVWELQLGPSPAWQQLTPSGIVPPARRVHVAVFDDATSKMLVFGGLTDTGATNDLWSLEFTPLTPQAPEVLSFSPLGGPAGTHVTILGHNLGFTTQVQFNGVDADILSTAPLALLVAVPPGATTGRIRVWTAAGSSDSPLDFFVGSPPIVMSATPDSGKAKTLVSVAGRNLVGTTRVSFNGHNAPSFTVLSDSALVANVPASATTGPISVTNPAGSGFSAFDFHVLPPDPRPRLIVVKDVKGDQGGRVALNWESSDLDDPTVGTITGYRVWRRAPAVLATAQSATDFWEAVADLPAAFLDGYAYTASTPYDSTADANPYTAFFVQALTADRFTFYSSNVDSGYSVDNLSPAEPAPFVASYSASQTMLHWGASRAPDFREFRLYRGAGPSFPLDPANLIATTRDTSHVDVVAGSTNYAYKLVAVDLHGNVSRAALVTPDTPVATLASLLSADATVSRIRLAWYSGDAAGASATVFRSEFGGEWQSVAQVMGDGTGVIRYEDHAIVEGHRYGYRLGLMIDGVMAYAGEVWLTAESPKTQVALAGAWPNPASGGRILASFDLTSAASASLELWDVAGRRIEQHEVGSLGPGHHVAEFGAGSHLAPGVYLLRLSAGTVRLTSRVVLIE